MKIAVRLNILLDTEPFTVLFMHFFPSENNISFTYINSETIMSNLSVERQNCQSLKIYLELIIFIKKKRNILFYAIN